MARVATSIGEQRVSHEPLYEVHLRTGDSIEIFYADEVQANSLGTREGHFWWMCRPGLLPDRAPKGPFATSYLSYRDATSRWLVEA